MLKIVKLKVSPAGQTLINNLTFELEPGAVLVILGQNGAGKTSLLNAIAGLERPASGAILFDDTNIFKLKSIDRAKLIGYLRQKNNFNFPATVFEAVLAGRFAYSKRFFPETAEDIAICRQALATVGLAAHEKQQVTTLSGGEQQRLALATLLSQNSQIMLMDEPLNNLDLRYRALIKQIVAFKTKKIFILVLHQLQLVGEIASHLLLIKDGEIKFGCKSEIFNQENMQWLYDIKMRQVNDNLIVPES